MAVGKDWLIMGNFQSKTLPTDQILLTHLSTKLGIELP